MVFFCYVTLGIKSIDVDLANQVVRIFGSSPVKIMAEALEQTGRKARLIGQGLPGGSFLFLYILFLYLSSFICYIYPDDPQDDHHLLNSHVLGMVEPCILYVT